VNGISKGRKDFSAERLMNGQARGPNSLSAALAVSGATRAPRAITKYKNYLFRLTKRYRLTVRTALTVGEVACLGIMVVTAGFRCSERRMEVIDMAGLLDARSPALWHIQGYLPVHRLPRSY
jgi:hypothetical protein